MLEVVASQVGIRSRCEVSSSCKIGHAVKRLPTFTADSRKDKTLMFSRVNKMCFLMPNGRVAITGPAIMRHDRTGIWSGAWYFSSKGISINVTDSKNGFNPYKSLGTLLTKILELLDNDEYLIRGFVKVGKTAAIKAGAGYYVTVYKLSYDGTRLISERKYFTAVSECIECYNEAVELNKFIFQTRLKESIDALMVSPNSLGKFYHQDYKGVNVVA